MDVYTYLMGWGTTQQIALCQCDITGVHDLMYISHWGRYMERDFRCLGLAVIGGIWRELGQPSEIPGRPKFSSADEVTKCDQNSVWPMRSEYIPKVGQNSIRSMRSLDRCSNLSSRETSDAYCMIRKQNIVEGMCHGERDHPESGWRVM